MKPPVKVGKWNEGTSIRTAEACELVECDFEEGNNYTICLCCTLVQKANSILIQTMIKIDIYLSFFLTLRQISFAYSTKPGVLT